MYVAQTQHISPEDEARLPPERRTVEAHAVERGLLLVDLRGKPVLLPDGSPAPRWDLAAALALAGLPAGAELTDDEFDRVLAAGRSVAMRSEPKALPKRRLLRRSR
jgi:hypothetical protein